jgi:hypothetical protein
MDRGWNSTLSYRGLTSQIMRIQAANRSDPHMIKPMWVATILASAKLHETARTNVRSYAHSFRIGANQEGRLMMTRRALPPIPQHDLRLSRKESENEAGRSGWISRSPFFKCGVDAAGEAGCWSSLANRHDVWLASRPAPRRFGGRACRVRQKFHCQIAAGKRFLHIRKAGKSVPNGSVVVSGP